MAMTPEAKVKKKVTDILKSRGAYYFYPVTGGYGGSGVPDIVACYKGMFLGIECKTGTKKPTKLQSLNLEKIANCGGVAVVINEDNMDHVDKILNMLDLAIGDDCK